MTPTSLLPLTRATQAPTFSLWGKAPKLSDSWERTKAASKAQAHAEWEAERIGRYVPTPDPTVDDLARWSGLDDPNEGYEESLEGYEQ